MQSNLGTACVDGVQRKLTRFTSETTSETTKEIETPKKVRIQTPQIWFLQKSVRRWTCQSKWQASRHATCGHSRSDSSSDGEAHSSSDGKAYQIVVVETVSWKKIAIERQAIGQGQVCRGFPTNADGNCPLQFG